MADRWDERTRLDRDDRGYRGYQERDRDRGFMERAGDEVRSWMGDDEAARRRRMDEQRDDRRDRDWTDRTANSAERTWDRGRDAVRDMTGHWPASAVHFEAFSEPETRARNDRPFRVRLAHSGRVVHVPVGTTILEALRAAGHAVSSSCESGTCGTCKTRLLEGIPDHRDFVLAGHERADHLMVCVSRALSEELVLDC